MNHKKRKLDKLDIIFMAIVVVCVAFLVYVFQFKKEGYHSDEMWTYGFANSYYMPHIFIDTEGNALNVNEWVDVKVLRDYLVVNKGEQFAYDSVYYNQSGDLNPPLHAMILHTISSFFPERFSPWFAFSINLFFYIFTLYFLWKLFSLFSNKRFSLLVCVFYGISGGAMDAFTYLRMYAMETGLFVCYLYLLMRFIYDSKNTVEWKKILPMCVVALIGFLTQYYFISAVGLLTFLFCVYLLFQKKIKKMFQLGFSMLGMLLLTTIAYPNMLNIVSGQAETVQGRSAEGGNYAFSIRMRALTNCITGKQFHIWFNWYEDYGYILWEKVIIVLSFLIFCIPLAWFFRNTKLVKNIVSGLIYFVTHFKEILMKLLKKINWVYVIYLLFIPLQLIVVCETSDVIEMGDFESRYIFFLYPIATGIVCLLLYRFCAFLDFKFCKQRKRIRMICVSIFTICFFWNVIVCMNYSPYFFLRNREGVGIQKATESGNVIYIDASPWLIEATCSELTDANAYFHTTPKEYADYKEEYMKVMDECPLYLLINEGDYISVADELGVSEWIGEKSPSGTQENNDRNKTSEKNENKKKEILQYYEDLVPETAMEEITSEAIFERPLKVYRINP